MPIMSFPHISIINEQESFLYFSSVSERGPCVRCSRMLHEAPAVRSGGSRIEVFYLKMPASAGPPETCVFGPLCWECVRAGAFSSQAEHSQWREATLRFLHDLRESDPGSYHCDIPGIG